MQRSTPASRRTIPWILAAALVVGCRDDSGPTTTTPREPRIVSLSPAVSRTLVDFGLDGLIVGRSPWCASLDPAIPVVGDLYTIDYERLIRLRPTHVLVQPPASTGLDPALQRLAAEHGWILGHWTFNTLDDITRMVRDLPGVLYPHPGPPRERTTGRSEELLARIATALSMPLSPPPGSAGRIGRTLLVADAEPVVIVFGRGTYLDEALTALGGENATTARGWAELSLEDVVRLDPATIVLVRDRGPADVNPLVAAGPIGKLDTTARREGRIAVLWHPDSKLPSSAVADVIRELRQVLMRLGDPPP